MLVLRRRANERILLGNDVVITVLEIHGKQVRLGIEAAPSVIIRREELAVAPAEAWRKREKRLPR